MRQELQKLWQKNYVTVISERTVQKNRISFYLPVLLFKLVKSGDCKDNLVIALEIPGLSCAIGT